MPSDRLPWWPPQHLHFDLLHFRQLFSELESRGYATDHKIHFTVLRNASVRLLDAVGLSSLDQSRAGFFCRSQEPDASARYLTWQDLCTELKCEGTPILPLNLAERIFMTMEFPDSSQLARVISVCMLLTILANLSITILASMSKELCTSVVDLGSQCGWKVQKVCIWAFSADYFLKLLCVGFVRLELLDREAIIKYVMQEDGVAQAMTIVRLTPGGRIFKFATNGMNLVDFVSIIPYWAKLLVGSVLPPGCTSFLRFIRFARMFRVVSASRYVQTFLVLFKTLVRTMRSMLTVMLFLFITAFIGGLLMARVEDVDNPGFSNALEATYWVGTHVLNINHKESAHMKGKVQHPLGVALMTAVSVWGAVLYILPIGQVKEAFDRESCAAKAAHATREELEYEFNKPAWSSWSGIQKSCRVHLRFWHGELAGPPKGRATMLVPILSAEHISAVLDIPVSGSSFRTWCGPAPSVSVRIQWTPSREMTEATMPAMPSGQLLVAIHNARGFPSRPPVPWTCRLDVPVGCCSERIETVDWVSSINDRTVVFDQASEFTVQWGLIPSKTLNEDAEFYEKVLQALEERAVRIQALEEGLQHHLGNGFTSSRPGAE